MTFLNEDCQLCDNQNSEIKPLHKKLKIVNKPYKTTYVAGLNIQGKYLNEFGFQVGDTVTVEVSKNKILIERVIGK